MGRELPNGGILVARLILIVIQRRFTYLRGGCFKVDNESLLSSATVLLRDDGQLAATVGNMGLLNLPGNL